MLKLDPITLQGITMSNLQEIADLENTVQVSARRFEESPHIARTGSPEMVRGVYAGR